MDEEYRKIEILHQKNDAALREYLSIKENLIEIQKKKKGFPSIGPK